MPDMTKPRKKRNDLSNIEEPERRAVAEIIRAVTESRDYTNQEFCNITGVSLPTINKLFRKGTGNPPTPRILKQMSTILPTEWEQLELFGRLLEAAGYSKELDKLPYEIQRELSSFNSDINKLDEENKATEDFLYRGLPFRIYAAVGFTFQKTELIYNIGFEERISNISLEKKPVTIHIENSELIDAWEFIICRGTAEEQLNNFLHKIIVDYPSSSKCKYTLVTNSMELIEKLKQISFPILDAYISIIYFDDSTLTEYPISTTKPLEEQVNAGLVLHTI